jgi:hypothetical protein
VSSVTCVKDLQSFQFRPTIFGFAWVAMFCFIVLLVPSLVIIEILRPSEKFDITKLCQLGPSKTESMKTESYISHLDLLIMTGQHI